MKEITCTLGLISIIDLQFNLIIAQYQPSSFTSVSANSPETTTGGANGKTEWVTVGLQSSVEQVSKASDLLNLDVYPNPVGNTLNVKVDSSNESKCDFSVFDESGCLLYTLKK